MHKHFPKKFLKFLNEALLFSGRGVHVSYKVASMKKCIILLSIYWRLIEYTNIIRWMHVKTWHIRLGSTCVQGAVLSHAIFRRISYVLRLMIPLCEWHFFASQNGISALKDKNEKRKILPFFGVESKVWGTTEHCGLLHFTPIFIPRPWRVLGIREIFRGALHLRHPAIGCRAFSSEIRSMMLYASKLESSSVVSSPDVHSF